MSDETKQEKVAWWDEVEEIEKKNNYIHCTETWSIKAAYDAATKAKQYREELFKALLPEDFREPRDLYEKFDSFKLMLKANKRRKVAVKANNVKVEVEVEVPNTFANYKNDKLLKAENNTTNILDDLEKKNKEELNKFLAAADEFKAKIDQYGYSITKKDKEEKI